MLLDVCHHVGYALLVLLQPSEGRQVRAASRALNEWYQSHQRDFDMSFRHGHQWAALIGPCLRLHTLRAFPNTIPFFRMAVRVQHLRILNLDNCGLTYVNVKTNGLPVALRQASNLRDFSVNDNPDLRTNGLGRLLHALNKSGAVLMSLSASNTGLQRLHEPASRLLASLKVLDLSKNSLSKETAWEAIRPLSQLEKMFVDLDLDEDHVLVTSSHLDTVSWCRCGPTMAQILLGSDNMVALSLGCTRPLSWGHLGRSLRELSLAEVTLPEAQWHTLMQDLAAHTCLEELALCKAQNLTGEALATFVRHLPQATKFTALCLRYTPSFTYTDLARVCNQLCARKIRMRKWILSNCGDLKFPSVAKEFIQTLHPAKKLYLDISTRSILSLSRRKEASWISSVLASGTFSYLGLGGRSVLLEDIPANFLADAEQLSLESAEINWGFGGGMARLRALSLYNVDSRYLDHDALLAQVLQLPRICHLRLDYCRLDDHIDIPVAKGLHTLDLNWCTIEPGFRNAFLHALVMGKLPALSSLGVMGSESLYPSFVCLLLLAMKHGHRNCEIDARGHAWTSCQLKFLGISLHQLRPGDMSNLRINVHADARAEWNTMRRTFPTMLLR